MFKTCVKIDGMMCPMCEKHMTEGFEEMLDAQSIVSSYKAKESIIISNAAPSEDDVKSAVEKAGYTFISMDTEPYEKKGVFSKLFKK